MPDLPDGFKWPVLHDKPLSFVAQIRLEEVAKFPPAHDLPAAGLLSFFYDAAQETYGASPDDRGGWSVSFFEPLVALHPVSFPDELPDEARFAPMTLQFQAAWTLPTSPQQILPTLNWSDKAQQNYESLLKDFQDAQGHKPPFHQMFGWPDQLQDDMQLQSAMMSSGISDANDPRTKAAEQKKADWQLLLQVDSDADAGMRWASYGLIYYWIETQALKARQFERSWLVLQSD